VLLWYAKAVQSMRDRQLTEPTGWRYFAAIHGFDPRAWEEVHYFTQGEHVPTPDSTTIWNQCQHGTWYFLPWHRGYLQAFEAIIRAEIKALGGPWDTWALPYWNYFKANQAKLPEEFATANWPDAGQNPLYEPQRYGPEGDSTKIYVPFTGPDAAEEDDALKDKAFIGTDQKTGGGFGGPNTPLLHFGRHFGWLEAQPHNVIHDSVGGTGPNGVGGVLSDPITAGLDPIFWFHHANIDRLWEVWKKLPRVSGDPTLPAWLLGPASVGDRAFVMPKPGGGTWTYTPADVQDLSSLDYVYDDVAPPAILDLLAARLHSLGRTQEEVAALAPAQPAGAVQPSELLGANPGKLAVRGREVATAVQLSSAPHNRLSLSFRSRASVPDHVFLNIENVKAAHDGAILGVYLNLPDGADPEAHPELKAGVVSLFGARAASQPDSEHGGDGINYVFDITDIVDRLHLSGKLGSSEINVKLISRNPIVDAQNVSIGRISVYRRPA
jgi:tyrosinase